MIIPVGEAINHSHDLALTGLYWISGRGLEPGEFNELLRPLIHSIKGGPPFSAQPVTNYFNHKVVSFRAIKDNFLLSPGISLGIVTNLEFRTLHWSGKLQWPPIPAYIPADETRPSSSFTVSNFFPPTGFGPGSFRQNHPYPRNPNSFGLTQAHSNRKAHRTAKARVPFHSSKESDALLSIPLEDRISPVESHPEAQRGEREP